MTVELTRLIETARGDRPADLVFTGGRIVDVFTRRILEGDVAVVGDTIAGIGRYKGVAQIDLQGRYLAPGFIDAHVHLESAMTSVSGFAGTVAPCGTTQVVADPHEIANVLGAAGIEYMLSAAENQPIRIDFMLSSCVPATDMETAGARLSADQLAPLFSRRRVLGLAEMMNFPGVVAAVPEVLAKIEYCRTRNIKMDGHAPGLSGRGLQAYLAAGITTDHECTRVEEAEEKLRSGMYVLVREGTAAKNLADLLPLVDEHTCRRMMWCTDDRHLYDLMEDGHIDALIRKAVCLGLDPLTALQMATLNPAEAYGLKHSGAVAPGRRADLVVFSDLAKPRPEMVFCRGERVAEDGCMCRRAKPPSLPELPRTMNLDPATVDFSVSAQGSTIRVIDLVPGQILTGAKTAKARVVDGRVEADVQRDLLKLAVVERYSGRGGTGIGFVRGFGLKQGALASSVAHDSHNIIAAGTNDEDMKAAVAKVAKMGGGLAVAAGGTVREALALPIAGLMSPEPAAEVHRRLEALMRAASALGASAADPFMTLSFLALPVIPALKLTDRGLIDVEAFCPVSLFL